MKALLVIAIVASTAFAKGRDRTVSGDVIKAARFLTSARKWLETVSLETPVY